jgi:hypothetical protein
MKELGQGIVIAALVIVILSIFIPYYGNFTMLLGIVLATIAGLLGSRALPVTISVLALVAYYYLSPSLWLVDILAATGGDIAKGKGGDVSYLPSHPFLTFCLLFSLLPLVAVAINASGVLLFPRKNGSVGLPGRASPSPAEPST